jgi:hypothetical protein
MLTYANMNMKRTRQSYGARLCIRLMLNKLKEMKGPILFISLWGSNSRKFPRRFYCARQVKNFFENLPN